MFYSFGHVSASYWSYIRLLKFDLNAIERNLESLTPVCQLSD